MKVKDYYCIDTTRMEVCRTRVKLSFWYAHAKRKGNGNFFSDRAAAEAVLNNIKKLFVGGDMIDTDDINAANRKTQLAVLLENAAFQRGIELSDSMSFQEQAEFLASEAEKDDNSNLVSMSALLKAAAERWQIIDNR